MSGGLGVRRSFQNISEFGLAAPAAWRRCEVLIAAPHGCLRRCIGACVAVGGDRLNVRPIRDVTCAYRVGTMRRPASEWVYGNAVRRSPSPTQIDLQVVGDLLVATVGSAPRVRYPSACASAPPGCGGPNSSVRQFWAEYSPASRHRLSVPAATQSCSMAAARDHVGGVAGDAGSAPAVRHGVTARSSPQLSLAPFLAVAPAPQRGVEATGEVLLVFVPESSAVVVVS